MFIRLLDLFEPLFGHFLKFLAKMRDFVRVILIGQLEVGRADFGLAGLTRNAQYGIWIPWTLPELVSFLLFLFLLLVCLLLSIRTISLAAGRLHCSFSVQVAKQHYKNNDIIDPTWQDGDPRNQIVRR